MRQSERLPLVTLCMVITILTAACGSPNQASGSGQDQGEVRNGADGWKNSTSSELFNGLEAYATVKAEFGSLDEGTGEIEVSFFLPPDPGTEEYDRLHSFAQTTYEGCPNIGGGWLDGSSYGYLLGAHAEVDADESLVGDPTPELIVGGYQVPGAASGSLKQATEDLSWCRSGISAPGPGNLVSPGGRTDIPWFQSPSLLRVGVGEFSQIESCSGGVTSAGLEAGLHPAEAVIDLNNCVIAIS